MTKRVILSLAIALCAWTTASAQQVAVKSNLFYWMTTTINAGAEVALSKHSTLGATFNLNPWTIGADNKIQHWFVRPEYRYWVTEKYTRLFFGVHLMGGGFEVGGFRIPIIGDRFLTRLQTNYFTGSFVAGGVSIGYQSTSAPTGTSKSRAARVWHASSTTGSRPTPPCAKRATRTPCATCPFPPRSASRSSICSTPRNNAT